MENESNNCVKTVMFFKRQIKEENRVCKCECEIQKNIAFEFIKDLFERYMIGGGGVGRKYTPLSEKDIKKTQIKSMETTHLHFDSIYFAKKVLRVSNCRQCKDLIWSY